MKWDYMIRQYIDTHCVARGLAAKTMLAYESSLNQFVAYVRFRLKEKPPDEISTCEVLTYVESLRRERGNGDALINFHVTVLRNFYRAMVAMDLLVANDNPMTRFPKIKATPRKLPLVLSEKQIMQLLDAPPKDTVIGLRDRAILALIYGTGIRALECASLCNGDVDLEEATIRVKGKGGHDRTLPLNSSVVDALKLYQAHRGLQMPRQPFFLSRSKKAMSRNAIYERVRKYGRISRVSHQLSPHKLRHTFATHLVRAGVNLVTIRDLLGHRQLSSTQIYLHVTAKDLRCAATLHPIGQLAPTDRKSVV